MVVVVGVVAAVGIGGCGSTEGPPAGDETSWAWEADAWMNALTEAEETRTSMQAVFYAADAVHDASMMGGSDLYAQGRSDVVAMQMGSSVAELIRGPRYLDVDGVVQVFTLDYPASVGPDNGPFTSLMHVSVGEEGIDRITHLRGTWYGDRTSWWETTGPARLAGWRADQVAADYVESWSTGEAEAIYRLYTPEATLTDSIRSVSAEGQESIIALAASSATPLVAPTLAETVPASVMDVDPFPDPSLPVAFFRMGAGMEGNLSEVWALVRSEAQCPGSWIAALTVDGDGRVITERRFPALDSLRACDDPEDLADGWWTGRDLPPPFGEPVVTSLETTAGTIEIHNGSPATDQLVMWAFDRFATAGLSAPAVSAISFDPFSERCTSTAGYADWSDGSTSILMCFNATGIGSLLVDPDAYPDDGSVELTPIPRRGHLMLHELSHAWLVDNVDDSTRGAFLAAVGLETWNDKQERWANRGVEWAAETVTWGLKGIDSIPLNLGGPSCDLIAEGFRILTGAEPLTSCPGAAGVEQQARR